MPISKSLVWLHLEKSRHKRDSNPESSAPKADLTTRPAREQRRRWRTDNCFAKKACKALSNFFFASLVHPMEMLVTCTTAAQAPPGYHRAWASALLVLTMCPTLLYSFLSSFFFSLFSFFSFLHEVSYLSIVNINFCFLPWVCFDMIFDIQVFFYTLCFLWCNLEKPNFYSVPWVCFDTTFDVQLLLFYTLSLLWYDL